MDSNKLLELLKGKEQQDNLPEGKKAAVKDVLTALKKFAEEMMSDDLKKKGIGEPELIGAKVKVATALPEDGMALKDDEAAEDKPDDAEKVVEEPDDEDEHMKKLRELMKRKDKPEEME